MYAKWVEEPRFFTFQEAVDDYLVKRASLCCTNPVKKKKTKKK